MCRAPEWSRGELRLGMDESDREMPGSGSPMGDDGRHHCDVRKNEVGSNGPTTPSVRRCNAAPSLNFLANR